MANPNMNPKTNSKKQDQIMELWYNLTGDKFAKINLATNEDLLDALPARTREYIAAIKTKSIPLAWKNPIEVVGDKGIHLSIFHDFNIYDTQNPQKGVEDNTSFRAIKQAVQSGRKKDKNVVFVSGNIIGKEFTIGKLANASIKDKKILFWGLTLRVEKMMDYLTCIAESGADEIILMDSRAEHFAYQQLNRNILEDALLDKYNAILLQYAVKNYNGGTRKRKVKISYVPGVKKVFKIKKINKKQEYSYDISMHTNLKTNSTTMKGNKSAADKQHGDLSIADQIFVNSENFAGKIDGAIYVPGLARYNDTTKGYVPKLAVSGCNTFDIILGNENHKLQTVTSVITINPRTSVLEDRICKEKAEIEAIIECAKKKLEDIKIDVLTTQFDYKQLVNSPESEKEGK